MGDVKMMDLRKNYGKTKALDGVSLTLKSGTLTAVLGPSGCGKTTMLRTLAGFLPLDSGRVLFGDLDVTFLPPQKRGAALVFQNYALWPHMSVYDNIAYGLKLKKLPKAETDRRVRDITELVGLDGEMLTKNRMPAQLSGGQQQRVALARALVVEPRLFLLDEPLSNLDAKVRSRLRVYIREIQQKVGITALYVTHDQEEALSIADTIVIMNKGRVMQIGTPEEIYNRPANLFVAEFIGDSARLCGRLASDGAIMLAGSPVSDIRVQGEARPPARAGDRVSVLLRSADIKIHTGDSAFGSDCIRLDAYAESAMFIGSQYKHVIRVGEETLYADWDADVSGRNITIAIDKQKVMAFADGA
ncbi:MAG: ABC transporter ATP-binding protein [Deltaproteobacteria bacterium]|jgi:ABC-type Fe3+/spermidine/putrescine transport system ATPase subunit|nr:ABC transporter ATP-binding protein [Deltaproteobacteria bacterium]